MTVNKPFFYRLHDEVKGLCVSVDIDKYIRRLKIEFNGKSRDEPLNDGPLYYVDAPRVCNELGRKYNVVDAISDKIRTDDKEGKARQALATALAARAVKSVEFREAILAHQLVPQNWRDMLFPLDPKAKPDRAKIATAFAGLQDRNYQSAKRAKGPHHPLAVLSEHLPAHKKLRFVRDFVIGKKLGADNQKALRTGTSKSFEELNLTCWLEANRAFRLSTVGDVLDLQEHFTNANRLKNAPFVEVPRVESGEIKAVHALQLQG